MKRMTGCGTLPWRWTLAVGVAVSLVPPAAAASPATPSPREPGEPEPAAATSPTTPSPREPGEPEPAAATSPTTPSPREPDDPEPEEPREADAPGSALEPGSYPTSGDDDAPAPAEPPARDELQLRDGALLRGRIIEVHEGAYVTIDVTAADGPPARRSVPWAELEILRLGGGARERPLQLFTSAVGLGREQPRPGAPLIEIVSETGRPVALAALRGQKTRGSSRYRSGFTIECRAPCGRVLESRGRTFFLDTDPWATSRLFTLPSDAERVRINFKPGNSDMRKIGTAFMALALGGLTFGTTMLSLAGGAQPPRRGLSTAGVTWLSLSPIFVVTGGILLGLGRTRVEVVALTPDGQPVPGSGDRKRRRRRRQQRR